MIVLMLQVAAVLPVPGLTGSHRGCASDICCPFYRLCPHKRDSGRDSIQGKQPSIMHLVKRSVGAHLHSSLTKQRQNVWQTPTRARVIHTASSNPHEKGQVEGQAQNCMLCCKEASSLVQVDPVETTCLLWKSTCLLMSML